MVLVYNTDLLPDVYRYLGEGAVLVYNTDLLPDVYRYLGEGAVLVYNTDLLPEVSENTLKLQTLSNFIVITSPISLLCLNLINSVAIIGLMIRFRCPCSAVPGRHRYLNTVPTLDPLTASKFPLHSSTSISWRRQGLKTVPRSDLD